MKLLTFNIRHGGGRRANAICRAVERHDADIVVLTEFRENAAGQEIKARLRDCGWEHQASSQPPPRANGVFVASKATFDVVPTEGEVPEGTWRWVECQFQHFSLVGTYFPLNVPKLPYWRWFLQQAAARADRACVMVGDFNTGKHHIDEVGATFIGPEHLDQLEGLGFVDSWRRFHPGTREYTWFSPAKNGFRLDYMFVSQPLASSVSKAWHSHTERELKVSDHAALLVELDL